MTSRTSSRSACAAVMVVLCAATTMTVAKAHADQPDPIAVQAETMRRANEKLDAGDYEGAITLYENVLRTLGEKRGFKVQFNLALAYESAGDVTSAIEHYSAFVEASEHEPFPTSDIVERANDAKGRIAALKQSHGAIHVTTTKLAPAFYRIAGGTPRAAGTTLWVAPGGRSWGPRHRTPRAHAVRAVVRAGETVDLRIEAPPSTSGVGGPTTNPTAHAEPTSESRFPTLVFILGSSATLASFTVPLVFGLNADSKRQAAEDASPFAPDYSSLRSEYDGARTRYVSYAVPAVVALIATVAVILATPSRRRAR